jgi:leader peptidase (prepilin peptidase) / N-methyltransferase
MTRHPVTLRVGIVYATLIAVATLWGAATGLLVPRAAYGVVNLLGG